MLRHAHSIANQRGILAGQLPNIGLSDRGKSEARNLISILGPLKIDQIISSPLQRCQETIEPFLEKFSGQHRADERLIEMDYGQWSGKKLKVLALRPLWRTIQRNPAGVEFPHGESFSNMQHRVTSIVDEVLMRFRNKTVLLVTHGDICKFLTTHFLGLPFNDFQKFQVDPASLSVYRHGKQGFAVSYINVAQSRIEPGRFVLGGSNR